MSDDEFREMQLRVMDLNNRVNNMSMIKKVVTAIASKKYETVLFLILLVAISISHVSMQNTLIKKITESSIKNSNSIKKQIKEYHYGVRNHIF